MNERHLGRREGQRRPNLQDVAGRPGRPDEHASLAQALLDRGRPSGSGVFDARSRTISTPIARPMPRTSPIASWRDATSRMPARSASPAAWTRGRTRSSSSTSRTARARRRGDRVATERAEEHGLVGEPGRDLPAGDDRARPGGRCPSACRGSRSRARCRIAGTTTSRRRCGRGHPGPRRRSRVRRPPGSAERAPSRRPGRGRRTRRSCRTPSRIVAAGAIPRAARRSTAAAKRRGRRSSRDTCPAAPRSRSSPARARSTSSPVTGPRSPPRCRGRRGSCTGHPRCR